MAQFEKNSNLNDYEKLSKEISVEKKSLLIWYILQHAQNYKDIRDFLVSVIKNDTVIYQKHEKNIMKSIITNWDGVGGKLI